MSGSGAQHTFLEIFFVVVVVVGVWVQKKKRKVPLNWQQVRPSVWPALWRAAQRPRGRSLLHWMSLALTDKAYLVGARLCLQQYPSEFTHTRTDKPVRALTFLLSRDRPVSITGINQLNYFSHLKTHTNTPTERQETQTGTMMYIYWQFTEPRYSLSRKQRLWLLKQLVSANKLHSNENLNTTTRYR